jgi:hypothetical protein
MRRNARHYQDRQSSGRDMAHAQLIRERFDHQDVGRERRNAARYTRRHEGAEAGPNGPSCEET